jgi:hypothetical protein
MLFGGSGKNDSSLITPKDAVGGFPEVVTAFDLRVAFFNAVVVTSDEDFPLRGFPPLAEVEAFAQQSIVTKSVDFICECGGW